MKNTNCAIVIPSCDAYQDAWGPFFAFFFKYWPDCPFDIFLVTDTLDYPDERVKTIKLGQDYGWAQNVTKVLQMIPHPYFIWLVEDVYLTDRVDTARILKLLDIAIGEKAACLRLFPEPGPDQPFKDYQEVGEIKKGAPYRASAMAAFFDKQLFINLLEPEWSAWDFETKGSIKSNELDAPFLSVPASDYAIKYFVSGIKKRRWTYDGLKMIREAGFPVDTSRRPVETEWEFFFRHYGRHRVWGWPIRKLRHFLNNKAKRQ